MQILQMAKSLEEGIRRIGAKFLVTRTQPNSGNEVIFFDIHNADDASLYLINNLIYYKERKR